MSARDWSAAERRTKAAQGYGMWVRGTTSYRHIARKLDVDQRTAKALIEEERELRRIGYAAEIERSILVHKQVQEEAWHKYDILPEGGRLLIDPALTPRLEDGSFDMDRLRWVEMPAFHNYKVAYLKVVMASQQEIDKTTGASRGPEEADPANVSVSVTVQGNTGQDRAAQRSSARDELLAALDAYRTGIDDAERARNPRLTLDTEDPHL